MSCKHCNLPCSKPYWWSPSQIKFCWSQVLFLLANYGTFKASKWPQKPSGYIDTHEDVQQSIREPITWMSIIEVRGELNMRIAKLPELMQNLIFDRRINWENTWYYLVEDELDEKIKKRLLTAAHDIVNYLKGHSERRVEDGREVTVNVANEQDFNHWKADKERKSRKQKAIKSMAYK